jgi:hypothetical protein
MNIRDFLSEDAPLQKFLVGYLEAMCFTDLPEEEVGSGEFRLWTMDWSEKFSEELLIKAMATCATFWVNAHELVPVERVEEAGRDAWYTIQGHGVGFWESEWDSDNGAELTERCEAFAKADMYVGDDGLLYLE